MKKYLFGLLLVLVMTSFVFAEENSEKIEMKGSFTEGATYRFHQVYTETITQDIPDQTRCGTINTNIDSIYSCKVKKAFRNKAYLIEFYTESIKRTQSGPDGVRSYDSSDVFGNVTFLDVPLAILSANSFEMKLDSNGKCKVIKGYEHIIKDYIKSIDFSSLPKGTKGFLKSYLNKSIGNKALEEMFQNDIFPKKPVAINDSWENQKVSTSNIPYISNSIFTLKDRRNNILTIDIKSGIQANLKAPSPVIFNNYEMKYDFIGEETGTIELFETDGIILRYQVNSKLIGELVAVKGPNDFKDKKWPFNLESEIIIEYMPEGLESNEEI